MFILGDSQPPPRAQVQIEVFFSSLVETGSTLRMKARAQVVRVEPPTPSQVPGGFAAVSRSYILHNGMTNVEE